ncbi:MAG: hypothetical protein AAF959_02115 [Cyanobacteria bacterium P01_D01_bin.56]
MSEDAPTTLSLLFWEHFPGAYGGECVLLNPNEKKYSWTAGRKSSYPVDFAFEVGAEKSALSRLQFTIYYDRRRKEWLLIDGGVYQGDEFPTRSKNGFKIKYGNPHLSRQKTAPGEWLKISGGQTLIAPGDFIWLCPGYRIIIGTDCEDTTVGGFLWEDSHWEVYENYKDPHPVIDTDVVKDLRQKPHIGPWEVIADWTEWLQSPPKNSVDLINRCLVGLFLLAILGMGLTYWHLRSGGDLPGVTVEEPG